MSIGFRHGQLGQVGLCHLLARRVSIRLGAGQEWPDGFTLGRATGSAQPPPPTIASPKHLKASSLVATPVKG